jgi:hypothetical protein
MIILNSNSIVSAKELCDKDLRATLKLAGNLATKGLENRIDEDDPTLRWVGRSQANLKWMVNYAIDCAAESIHRFLHRAKIPPNVYDLLMLEEIEAGEPNDLPEDPDRWVKHYMEVVGPKSVWPKCLWTKRYPPDWLSPIIYPNAKLS